MPLTDILIAVPTFLVVLTIIVFVHEMGHFWAARLNGVAVDAFSLGWGKSLVEWRDRSGVRWKVGRWPIGGFVKFRGDENAASLPMTASYEDPAERAAARAQGILQAMPLRVRALVAAAGSLSNFTFAVLAFAALAMIVGRDVEQAGPQEIGWVQEDSAAAAAGLRPGDLLLAQNGSPIISYKAFQHLVRNSAGKPLQLRVRRETAELTLTLTPRAQEITEPTGRTRKVGVIGVARAPNIVRLGPLSALRAGAEETGAWIVRQALLIGNLVTGQASAGNLAGPIGIAQLSGEVAKSALKAEPAGGGGAVAANLALALLQLCAVLSVAIGFINLLPLPVLDGGALAFFLIEAVRGRPLGLRGQNIAYTIGLGLVAILFLFATWNDLRRVLAGATG